MSFWPICWFGVGVAVVVVVHDSAYVVGPGMVRCGEVYAVCGVVGDCAADAVVVVVGGLVVLFVVIVVAVAVWY